VAQRYWKSLHEVYKEIAHPTHLVHLQAHSWLGVLAALFVPSHAPMGHSDVSTLVFLVKHVQRAMHSLLQSGEQVPWVPKHCAMPVEFAG